MVFPLPFSIYKCSTSERTLTFKLKVAENLSPSHIKKQGATLGIALPLTMGTWPASPDSLGYREARAVYPTRSGALYA